MGVRWIGLLGGLDWVVEGDENMSDCLYVEVVLVVFIWELYYFFGDGDDDEVRWMRRRRNMVVWDSGWVISVREMLWECEKGGFIK